MLIRLFKGLNIAYYFVSGVLGVILAVALVFANVNYIYALLIVLAWTFLTYLLFNSLANKKMRDIQGLRNQCHTKAFLEEFSKLQKDQKEGSFTDSIVKLNLSAGFLDLGDLRNAFQVLSSVKFPKRKLGSNGNANNAIAATYHNNFSLAFLKDGNVGGAIDALNACRKIVYESKIAEKDRTRFLENCQLRQGQIDIATLNEAGLPGAEAAFKRYRDYSNTLLEKTSASYWLARIAYLKGNREEEKRLLTFVAANGGDTMYAKEAKSILEKYKGEEAQIDNEYVDYFVGEDTVNEGL